MRLFLILDKSIIFISFFFSGKKKKEKRNENDIMGKIMLLITHRLIKLLLIICDVVE